MKQAQDKATKKRYFRQAHKLQQSTFELHCIFTMRTLIHHKKLLVDLFDETSNNNCFKNEDK